MEFSHLSKSTCAEREEEIGTCDEMMDEKSDNISMNMASGDIPDNVNLEEPASDEPSEYDHLDEEEIMGVVASGQLPVSKDTAMALNSVYQTKIDEFLDMLEQKIEENAQKRSDLECELAVSRGSEERTADSDNARVPTGSFLPPYFHDSHGMAPLPNADAKRMKSEFGYLNPLMEPARKWNNSERDQLMNGIRGSLIDRRTESFRNKRDELTAQFTTAGEGEHDTLNEEITKLQSKIDKITKKFDLLDVPEKEFESIDWSKISATDLRGTRTDMECRVAFFNIYHPWLNQDPKWSEYEMEKLQQLADKYKGRMWTKIAVELGTGRTAFQCFEKYQMKLNPNIVKRNWSSEDDEELRKAVEICRVGDFIPWELVTNLMEGRTRPQCHARWTNKLDPTLKSGRWDEEEDEMLRAAVEKYGSKAWSKISQTVPGRNEAQCRDHWSSALKEHWKRGPWTLHEDKKLLEGVKTFGVGKWISISQTLDGRNASSCKSRYRKLARKKKAVSNA